MSLSRSLQYLFLAIVTISVGFSLYQWNASRASTQKTAPKNGLVGYWSFDENTGTKAGDASGNGNTGTLTNGPTWVSGKLGQAVNFDGVDDYVITNLTTHYSQTTFSAWIYPRTLGEGNLGRIFDKRENGGTETFFLSMSTGTNKLLLQRDFSVTNGLWNSPNSSIVLNAWNHIVITYDETSTANDPVIYINGISVTVSEVAAPSGTAVTNADKYIIGNRGDTTRTFDGIIDEVRIYNRALSGTEVTNLYNLGAEKLNVSPTTSLTSGLVGYWTFDGKDTPWSSSSAGTATDRSGNSNTGTLTNMNQSTTPAIGKLGQALNFDGVNDYVSVTDASSINPTSVSMSAWVKTSTTGSYIVAKNPAAGDFSGSFSLKANTICSGQYGCTTGGINTTGANLIVIAVDSYPAGTPAVSDSLGNTWTPLTEYSGTSARVRFWYALNPTVGAGQTFSETDSNNANYILTVTAWNGAKTTSSFDVENGAATFATSIATGSVTPSENNELLISSWRVDESYTSGVAINSGFTISNSTALSGAGGGMAYLIQGTAATVNPTWSNFTARWTAANIATFKVAAATNIPYALSTVNGGEFLIKSGATTYTVDSSVSVADGKWHFMTATYDGTTMRIYIDGVQTGSSTSFSGNLPTQAGNVRVGADYGATPGNFFTGSLDDVRIYNRALSATEVQSLYDLGASDKVNSSVSQNQGVGRLDSGLVGYWKLDDGSGTTATDSSTNGKNGTLTNGPTWGTGQIGGDVVFDGTDDHITMGDQDVLDMTGAFTVSAWVYPNSFGGNSRGRIVDKNSGLVNGYIFMLDNFNLSNGIIICVNGSAYPSSTCRAVANAVTLSTWQHFVASFDGTNVTLYKNGISLGAQTLDKPNATTNNFVIGGRTTDNTRNFNGNIDEVRVYNRALSADEVSQLYRLTAPTGVDTSLKGYWSFNGSDISGTTAYDRSGAGNNGTLTNGPTPAIGKLGQALNFDGTDDYVIASGNSASLQLVTAFTLSGWIKASTNTSDYRTIVSRENTATDRNYWFALDTGTGILSLRFSVAGVAKTFTSSVALADNRWHHVVATYDGSFVNIYSDGVSVMTPVAQSGSIDNPAATSLRIGTQLSTRYFIGQIDEVRVYNRALSATEVAALYNSGR